LGNADYYGGLPVGQAPLADSSQTLAAVDHLFISIRIIGSTSFSVPTLMSANQLSLLVLCELRLQLLAMNGSRL